MIKTYRRTANAIEVKASGSGTTYRIRLESGTLQEELRVSMRDYTPEMLNKFALDFVVKIGTDGTLTALRSAILSSSSFGLNRCDITTFAN